MYKLQDITTDKVKKKLNVLKPGETRRQKLWDQCVLNAKELMEKHKEIRFEIVRLAEKCCLIHHGGSVGSGNRYTLRAFAKDIGVPWGTFYEWYGIKKNIFMHLSKDDQKKVTYMQMKHMRTGMPNIDWKDKDIKTTVRKQFKKIKKKTDTTVKMEKYLLNLRTLHFNCVHPRMIRDCNREILGEIAHLCRGILNGIGKYDRN